MKPDFLVAGCQRCGTTWLFQRLLEHEDIYVPKNRKEVEYFDNNYQKGLSWYEKYFEDANDGSYSAIGEVTPNYIIDKYAMERIREDLPGVKIILIIREPVDRLISHYKYWIKNFDERKSLMEFAEDPAVIEKGLYSAQVDRIYQLFGKDNCHVIVYEEMITDYERELYRLGAFLSVDNEKWILDNVEEKVNTSDKTRLPWLFMLLRKTGRAMRMLGLDGLIEGVKRSRLMKMFDRNEKNTADEYEEERRMLYDAYAADIRAVSVLLGRDIWK